MANGRCRLHGGKSTGPKTPNTKKNRLVHGIYSNCIHKDEKKIWDDIPIGTLDDEIRILRLRLRRAIRAQTEAEKKNLEDESVANECFEVADISDNDEFGRTIYRKRPDYRTEIYRLTKRIADLEEKRLKLIDAKNSDEVIEEFDAEGILRQFGYE